MSAIENPRSIDGRTFVPLQLLPNDIGDLTKWMSPRFDTTYKGKGFVRGEQYKSSDSEHRSTVRIFPDYPLIQRIDRIDVSQRQIRLSAYQDIFPKHFKDAMGHLNVSQENLDDLVMDQVLRKVAVRREDNGSLVWDYEIKATFANEKNLDNDGRSLDLNFKVTFTERSMGCMLGSLGIRSKPEVNYAISTSVFEESHRLILNHEIVLDPTKKREIPNQKSMGAYYEFQMSNPEQYIYDVQGLLLDDILREPCVDSGVSHEDLHDALRQIIPGYISANSPNS